uniref:Uncharacterized protein n=1 Tax=Otus sunia TaxID=257818 RepID=A0A8C8EAB7_9STRI
MKLRALCDSQLSAKSVITSLLHSAKPHKNSKGLEDSSMTGDHSTESSKPVLPFMLEYTDTARNVGNQVVPKETKVVKEFIQKSTLRSAKNSAALSSTTAASPAAGQKQQLSPLAKICSTTNSNTITKKPGMDLGTLYSRSHGSEFNGPTSEFELLIAEFGSSCCRTTTCKSNTYCRFCLEANHILLIAKTPQINKENACLLISLTLFCFTVTTATPDKRSVQYNASTSGCFTTTMTTALNQPVWPSIIFTPFPISPGHLNFPHIPVPPFFMYAISFPLQVPPYNPQQIFQPPYAPILNSISLVQPGYPYQQVTPLTLPTNIQDLSPTAGNGIQYPFPPSYGYGHADLNSTYFPETILHIKKKTALHY